MTRQSIIRLPDWPERLVGYLATMGKAPFEWGKNDCILFALCAAQAITGLDTAKGFRGKYKNALGAARVMRMRFGAVSLSEAASVFATELGSEEVSTPFAQRGDIVEADVVSAEGGSGPSLGVVDLDGVHALFAGPSGAIRIKIADCRRAWRVG